MVSAERTVRIAVASWLSLLWCLSGCSDECPRLETCDVRDADCQTQVAGVIACLRGTDSRKPRVRVVSARKFLQEQIDSLEEDPYEEQTLDRYRAAALLGLMPDAIEPAALQASYWDDVAAFYDPETRRITVLDHGRPMDDAAAVVVLAHELVHAEQHRELGDDFHPAADESRDARLAARAMTEGEATLYQDFAIMLGSAVALDDVDWRDLYLEFRYDMSAAAMNERSIYQLAGSYFSYAFGGGYLADAYSRGGLGEVRAALRRVPASTRAVIASDRTPRPVGGWVESVEDVARPELSDDFVHVSTERTGAWFASLALDRWGLRDGGSFEGLPVRGDSLSVFRHTSGEVAVFWRMRFATAKLAQSARGRIEVADAQLALDDRDLLIAAASGALNPGPALERLTWVPDSPTEEEESTPAQTLGCALRLSDLRR